MGKQFTFCANSADTLWLYEVVKEVFASPMAVPYDEENGSIEPYSMLVFNLNTLYFTDKVFIPMLAYFDYQRDDGSVEKVLDYGECPVVEYSASVQRADGLYGFGRFYCSYNKDKNFAKMVSTLFRKLKKEFLYCKEHQLYVSKTIDLDYAKFYLLEKETHLNIQDLR